MFKPCTFIATNMVFMFICALFSQEYQIFNLNQSIPRDFIDRDSVITRISDQVISSYVFFSHHLNNYDQQTPKDIAKQIEAQEEINIAILYKPEEEGSSILTYNYLNKIKLVEDTIKNVTLYDTEDKQTNFWRKVCLVDSIVATDCAASSFLSPIDVMTRNGIQMSGSTNQQLQQDFNNLMLNQEEWQKVHFLFNQEKDIIENNKVQYMRTLLRLGLPYVIDGKKYQNSNFKYQDQRDYAIKFKNEIEKAINTELAGQQGEPMTAIVFQEASLQESTLDMFMLDFGYSLYAFVMFMVYLFIYLRSILLTIYIGLIVFFSFTCTATITEGIFGVKYFTMSHYVVVFILIHVTANSLIYITEIWRRSNRIKEYKQHLSQRFAYTTRLWTYHMNDSMLTMSVSLFLYTLVPFMPFKAYAIFAGTLVIVTWFQMYFAYPPMLIWYEAFWEKNFDERIKRCFTSKDRNVDSFYRNSFNWFVKNYKRPIFSLFLLMTILLGFQAVKITPLKNTQSFLNEKHELMAGSVILRD